MVIKYSLSLWKFHCDLLYGSILEEAKHLELIPLHDALWRAYKEFENDSFMFLGPSAIYSRFHEWI